MTFVELARARRLAALTAFERDLLPRSARPAPPRRSWMSFVFA